MPSSAGDGRPSEVGPVSVPDNPGSTRDELTVWSVAIAEMLLRIREDEALAEPEYAKVIDECWVGREDLAIYIRYGGGYYQAGFRVARLHIDLCDARYPAARSVASQAATIYDDMHTVSPSLYTDRLGYEWFGFIPEHATWEWCVHDQPRLWVRPPAPKDPLEWAADVATALGHLAGRERSLRPHEPVISSCWIGADLALYLRYHHHGVPRGHRTERIRPEDLLPEFSRTPANVARQIWHELGAATPPDHVDDLGFAWDGDPPEAPVTWAHTLNRVPRAFTVGTGRTP